MQVKFFETTRQNQLIKKEFLKKVEEILDSGNICMGKLCQEFEEKWGKKNGCYCALVSSGTDALILAIDALDIKGLILTSSLSFVATINAISLNRKQILFCDVKGSDGNINSLEVLSKMSIQKYINPVGAILAVAMYGCPPDIKNLSNIAKAYDVPLIIDGAQSHLSTFDGKPLANYCDIVTESFYITKCMGAFTELGCILTKNKNLLEKIKCLRNHGRGTENYDFVQIGYNSRPCEISASSLLVKLPFVDSFIDKRIEIAQMYNKNLKYLKDTGKLNFLEPSPNVKCVYHLFPIWINNPLQIQSSLLTYGIETQRQYPIPLHQLACYKELGYGLGSFPVSEKLCQNVLTLPCYPELTKEEINYVCDKLSVLL